ncbi:MAG: hypothetical protein JW768_15820 [Chitinispirillaceae bacterium]|nr:hypothetical protein [Chitinispirillaceae bacterium]
MMRIRQIAEELKQHSPFTFIGALSGIAVAVLFRNISSDMAHILFYTFHPIHVVLSALVTASMYRIKNYRAKTNTVNVWALLLIGYIGSIGIATLSDSIIPFIGELLLGLPNKGAHIGFIEKWWLVNPLALAGVAIAYFIPRTRFPHAGHVLLSTWASTFHILMAGGQDMPVGYYFVVFAFLFVAVWIPCCVSDIVFPLIFVKKQHHGAS